MLENYLKPNMTKNIREFSVGALAHVGDGVYGLMVRTYLCQRGEKAAKQLHKKSVAMVSAKAQAAATEFILPMLTDDEVSVYKRGRNAFQKAAPKSSTHGEYHAATALETLFGYLFLIDDQKRLNELFSMIIEKGDSNAT